MKLNHQFVFLFLIIFSFNIYSQEIFIGAENNQARTSQGGLFNYSDPQAVNISVNVWGFVKFPGRYIVPNYFTARDLLSLAGGPDANAHLDDIRIYRKKINENESELIRFDYNDLLWSNNIEKIVEAPLIEPGDILIIPGSPRFYFRDYLSIGLQFLSIISSVVSLTLIALRLR